MLRQWGLAPQGSYPSDESSLWEDGRWQDGLRKDGLCMAYVMIVRDCSVAEMLLEHGVNLASTTCASCKQAFNSQEEGG